MVLSVADMVVADIVCGRDIIMSVTLLYCGQTVGWINIKLGMPVGLGSGHIVLVGDPASPFPKGGGAPKIFGPHLLWPNGWLDQDATWYVGRS